MDGREEVIDSMCNDEEEMDNLTSLNARRQELDGCDSSLPA